MTLQEAINTLNSIKEYYNDKNEDSYVGFDNEDNEALDMAIKALEQEPCENWYDVPSDEMTLEQARQAVRDLRKMWAEHLEQEPCEDAISRQAVLDMMQMRMGGKELYMAVYDLPSVTPKQKAGKWIEHCYQNLSCSNCGYIVADTDIDEYKYCPNCGAKMEVSDDT